MSILLPVRNGARWLHEAIESVLSQTFTDLELLIIDDGSNDESPFISDEYARRDKRVRTIRQLQLGLAAALNRGIAEVRGALIARLDADDRAASERIEHQFRYLNRRPDIGLLGTWAERIDKSGKHVGWLRPETRPRELMSILQAKNPFIHSSIMLRADIARRLGGYRRAFEAAEDYDLWLRVAEVATVANLPEVLVQYRWHAGSVTKRNELRQGFSARLARNCAKARREGLADPANHLTTPPDWHSPCSRRAFYSRDAELYRLLDVPENGCVQLAHLDFSPLLAQFDQLSHAERKLAASAMTEHLRRGKRPCTSNTRRVMLRLLRRRPGMLLPLVRSALGLI